MSDTASVTSATHTITSVADTIKSLYRLSEDLIKFFEKTQECDVTLEIGKEPDFKKFSAHSSILRARSSYFYKALSKKSEGKNDDAVSLIYSALFTFVSDINDN